jgi:tetratricopeptide (TPR) repeat protein
MKDPFKSALSAVKKLTLMFVLSAAAVAQGAPYIVNSAGQQVFGTAIQAQTDGTVLLTTPQGQTLAFAPGAYREAFADKPAAIDEAVALTQAGDLAEAADRLEGVKRNYAHLGWDRQAGRMLGRVYLLLEQFDEAAGEYEELFTAQPELKENERERFYYMQALAGAGRAKEAAAMVDEEIAKGTREAAARAQLVRGDLKMQSGQIEEALLDYLRTAILFRAQTETIPDATYRTATALKKLNDPRAANWFQLVVDEFPRSDFAGKAKGELE